jgi:hypothetical protein
MVVVAPFSIAHMGFHMVSKTKIEYRFSRTEILWFVEQMRRRAMPAGTAAHLQDLDAVLRMLLTGVEPHMLREGTA